MLKTCPVCNFEIQKKSKQWATQIYCTTKCRKIAHRKKKSQTTRLEQKRANMRQNDEILYLVRQCRRAKTIQILHGHDTNSFIDTMTLVRSKPKGDVHLCHIAPVKGKDCIGLFHCQNLFYGGSHQNKKFGNKWLGGGLKINKEDINKRWNISETMSTNDILIAIETYLGNTVQEYLIQSPVRKSKKAQLANKIISINPENIFENLIQLSHNELLKEWGRISKQFVHEIQYKTTESKYITYMDEISRFISYQGNNVPSLKKLRKTMAIFYVALNRIKDNKTYNKEFDLKYGHLVRKHCNARLKHEDCWSEVKDLVYDAAFKMLLGKSLDGKKFHSRMLEYLE